MFCVYNVILSEHAVLEDAECHESWNVSCMASWKTMYFMMVIEKIT